MLAIIIKWLRQYFVSSLVLPCWTLYSKHFTKYQTGLCYLRKRFRSFHGTLENLTAAKNITIPASLISMSTWVGLGAPVHCLSSLQPERACGLPEGTWLKRGQGLGKEYERRRCSHGPNQRSWLPLGLLIQGFTLSAHPPLHDSIGSAKFLTPWNHEMLALEVILEARLSLFLTIFHQAAWFPSKGHSM